LTRTPGKSLITALQQPIAHPRDRYAPTELKPTHDGNEETRAMIEDPRDQHDPGRTWGE